MRNVSGIGATSVQQITFIYRFFKPLEKFFDEEITISQWEYVIVQKEVGKSNHIIKKSQKNLSVEIVLSMLEELSSFNIHMEK